MFKLSELLSFAKVLVVVFNNKLFRFLEGFLKFGFGFGLLIDENLLRLIHDWWLDFRTI